MEGMESQGTSFVRSCLNTTNALLGVGILATPYALSQGGWISLMIFFIVALICCYTGILLKRCIDANPHIKSYPDVAEIAYGVKGRILVSVFLYLELYLMAVELLILEGDNLAKLFPNGISGLGKTKISVEKSFILVSSLVILPTTWLRNLGLLAYMSAGGILAVVLVIVSVFWVGAFGGAGFHKKGTLFDIQHVSTSMSLYIFCFGGHAVFPTLYNSMRNKKKFPQVLMTSFLISTIAYGSMAIFGYLMYGGQLKSQVTLNLPIKEISTKIAIYTTLVTPLTKYALIVSPIYIAMEEKLQLHRLGHTRELLVGILVRTSLVASTVVVALVFPMFEYVMAFMGSFLIVTLSIVLPCLCFVTLNGFWKKKPEMVIVWAIMGVGVVAGAIGTYNSIRNVVRNI